MANTTFNGPVRSENGFKSITINSTTGAVTNEAVYDTRPNFRQTIDNSTFNTGSDVTDTLTIEESGTLFTIDGTGDIVVNMPALATANVGTTYEFIVTTAVGSGKTVIFVLPGSAVSNWYAAIQLMGGSAANPATDVAGDTLTLPNSTVVNSRVKLTCLTDDATNSTWKAETLTSPIATSA
mgnify:CR=1 FL=1|jgi:hypothetical protein